MKKLPNLDSIRSIAFLTVFMAHAFSAKTEAVLNNPVFKGVVQFREVLSFGVPVFFVLSGFLISYLMLKEQSVNNKFSVKNFYIRRVLRIWPLYFLIIGFGFIIFPLIRTLVLNEPTIENANPVNYLFFLSNFDQIWNHQLPFGVGLGPTWSVSVEEQYYLLWPLLFAIFRKRLFIIPIILIIVVSTILTYRYGLLNQHTILCFIYLSNGALFAYLAFYHNEILSEVFKSRALFIAISVLVIFLMYLSTVLGNNALIIFSISFLLGYIIYYQSFIQKLELRKIPYLEWLGKYTYGLYLYHSICIFFVSVLIYDVLQVNESLLVVVVLAPVLSLSLSVVVGYFSYHYLENWFLKLKNKFSSL